MDIYLPQHDVNLSVFFMLDAKAVEQKFSVGVEAEADIELHWSRGPVSASEKRSKSVSSTEFVGIFNGERVDENGETVYLVDSVFEIELTLDDCFEGDEPPQIGTWVELRNPHEIFDLWPVM